MRAHFSLITFTAVALIGGYLPDRQTSQVSLPAPDSMHPTLRIGGVGGGGHILTSVTANGGQSRFATTRGLIFIGQPADGNISVFDSTGRAVRQLGRRGQGPGEFEEQGAIGVAGDTLWAADFPSNRIHLFSFDGRVIATREFIAATRMPTLEWDLAFAYMPGGSAVFRLLRSGTTPENGIALPYYFMKLRAAGGGHGDTVVRVDSGGRLWRVVHPGGGTFNLRQPFDDSPLTSVTPTGAEIVLVDRRATVANATSARVRIRRVATATGETRIHNLDLPVARVPQRFMDSVLDRRATSLMERSPQAFPSVAAARTAFRASLFIPPHVPAVQRAIAGTDGSIWLQRFDRDEWIVVGSNGQIVRSVRLPSGSAANILAVSAERAWISTTTSADEPQVVRYDLLRR